MTTGPTSRGAPLAAIDAIAIDTETTGLDVRKAEIIEIAAVELRNGALVDNSLFETFVACVGPMPAAATVVHGLTAADLVGAPDFPEAWSDFRRFAAGRVWIGYAIAFDLAMMKRQCEESGLGWKPPVAIDLRLLAQFLEPRLPDYSLEALCAWTGVAVDARHRATPDARLAANVFLALLPRLRAAGVRTLGEARAVCRRESARATVMDSAPFDTPDEETPLARIDSYPYRHRLREVMSAPPVFVPGDATLAAAIARMADKKISSVFLDAPGDHPKTIGILTERDALRAVAGGARALDEPASSFASTPLIAVPADAFVHHAIGRMNRKRIRHLAVTGEDGALVGAVSARDLLRLRANAAIVLGDDIDEADSVATLARAWAKLPETAAALLDEGVDARSIAAVIASEVCAATRRAAELAAARLTADGYDEAPCAYAILALGSAGRGETLLAMDQDNATLFADGEPDGPEDRWFARLGATMTAILDEIGVPFCKGGVMASKPDYRGSVATWARRIDAWLGRSTSRDLLSVDIFFDFRAVAGDGALAARLWSEAWRVARARRAFLKLLAQQGEGGESPFGFLGGWRAGPDGRLDLKVAGLRKIVAGARVLALHAGFALHSTHERLAALAADGAGGANDLAALDESHAIIVDAIIRQQIADFRVGLPATNRIDPKRLDRARTAALKRAIKRAAIIDDLVRDRLTD